MGISLCRQFATLLLAVLVSSCTATAGAKRHWWSSEDRELAVKRPSDHALYLKLVARVSWLVRNDELRNMLFQSLTPKDIFEILGNY